MAGRTTSAYWTEEEYAILQRLAFELGLAVNAVTRLALRRLVGLPTPSRYEPELERFVLELADSRRLRI